MKTDHTINMQRLSVLFTCTGGTVPAGLRDDGYCMGGYVDRAIDAREWLPTGACESATGEKRVPGWPGMAQRGRGAA